MATSAREPASSPSGTAPRALVALVLMAGWTALLVAPALRTPGVGASSLWQMRSLAGAAASLPPLLAALLLDVLRFAPLGLLAVFVFPDRAVRLSRAALVGLPAFGLAVLASTAALWCRDLSAGVPGPSDLVLPALGVALGVLAGLAWRRGLVATALLPLKLAAAALLAAIVIVGVLLASLEREPAVAQPAAIGSADKRQLVAVFRGRDPRTIPPGETRTLRLGQQDADRLLAWVMPLVHRSETARAALAFEADDTVALRGCLRVPRVERWLNLAASARLGVRRGRFFLGQPRLRIGRRLAPLALMDALAPALRLAIRAERRLRPLFASVRELRVEPGAVTATYGRIETPRGMLASLVWGEGTAGLMREPVAAQVRAIADAVAAAPAGDRRFARAYEAAFALARERSREGSAVEENRAAILGLGIVLGTSRLAPFAGDALPEQQRERVASLRAATTVRGRADWTRHFSLSSALAVLSSVAPSNAAGLLKEELDADGGSGFSFGDLLADRAGTTFGTVATRDERAAAAVQERIGRGFDVDAFFPPAADLPEGIPDPELRATYGGVGGPLYVRHAREIERRVAACAGYR